MSNRLQVLEGSLAKKQAKLDRQIEAHFADVRSANGQPLNDKRNGASTMARWDKQSDAIRNTKESIKITERAIQKEKVKIANTEEMKEKLPTILLELLEQGVITQWRRHPNTFFVEGVEKARLHFDLKKRLISCKYVTDIPNQEQYAIFRDLFNKINNEYNKRHSS